MVCDKSVVWNKEGFENKGVVDVKVGFVDRDVVDNKGVVFVGWVVFGGGVEKVVDVLKGEMYIDVNRSRI